MKFQAALQPCPFCGGTALRLLKKTVQCCGCGAQGPYDADPDEMWNERKLAPMTPADEQAALEVIRNGVDAALDCAIPEPWDVSARIAPEILAGLRALGWKAHIKTDGENNEPRPVDALMAMKPHLDALPDGSWWTQTGCSFRRIGNRESHADGDVLHAYNQRSDGHPDLSWTERECDAICAIINGLRAALSPEVPNV